MIFEEIAQLMDARPVKEIQRRTGLKKTGCIACVGAAACGWTMTSFSR